MFLWVGFCLSMLYHATPSYGVVVASWQGVAVDIDIDIDHGSEFYEVFTRYIQEIAGFHKGQSILSSIRLKSSLFISRPASGHSSCSF